MKKLFIILAIICIASYSFAASQQLSSTLASVVIDRAETRLNDSDNRLYAQTTLLQWLNDGMVDIVLRTHCLEGTDTEPLVANTVEYAISAFDSATWNYVTVKAVHYIDSSSVAKGLIPGNFASVGNVEDPGEPAFWYEWGGKIGVYPALTSVSGETIKAYYITRPTDILVDANITTPAIYDTALELYIVAQAYLRGNKMGRYLQTMSLYNQELARIRVDLNEQPQQLIE